MYVSEYTVYKQEVIYILFYLIHVQKEMMLPQSITRFIGSKIKRRNLKENSVAAAALWFKFAFKQTIKIKLATSFLCKLVVVECSYHENITFAISQFFLVQFQIFYFAYNF